MEPLVHGDPDRVRDYRLVARLGAGGMGVVYLGASPAGRAVAVKVIRPRYAEDDAYRARFRREAAAARTVTGAFTAAVLDADPDAAEPYLVTAYLPGVNLREAVATFGALSPASVRTLAAGLAEALADIHRAGLAHRDLKPGNIMLTRFGPRVIDFGIARPDDATAITRAGTVLGTPGFMAPEQVHGALAGPATDVFALGAVLAFAATGREPFGTGDPEETLRRVAAADADLVGVEDRELVEECLRVDPAARPSATALLDRLGHAGEVAGWLPAPVAEAIDRRAAAARVMLGPAQDAPPLPAVSRAVMAEPTEEPSVPLPTKEPARVSRRAVLLGSGATLLAGAGAAWALSGAMNPDVPRTPRAGRMPEATTTTPTVPVRGWRVPVSNAVVNLFTAGGTLIASSYNSGGIRALDPATGVLLWQRDGDIVITTAGDTAFLVNLKGWRVSATDAATGEPKWMYDPPLGESSEGAVLAADVICFGINGTVRAIGAADGQPRWTAAVKAGADFTGAGDVLVCVPLERVVGFDAGTGQVRWTVEMPHEFPSYPKAANGMVYVGQSSNGLIRALRVADGAVLWQVPGLGLSLPFWLAADANAMYYSADGEIRAFAAGTGAPLWTRPFGGRTGSTDYGNLVDKSTITLVGDTLYAVSNDGGLWALDIADGNVRWDLPGVPFGSEIVGSDGLVFVATSDGYVEAIRPPGGG